MGPKDEIQDSDDDGSDFTPVKDMDARPSLELYEHNKPEVPTGQGSDSTDRSFFEQVYNELKPSSEALLSSAQQTLPRGTIAPDEPGSLVENSSASAAAPDKGEVHLVDSSFLISSVTDPAATSRPAKSRIEKIPPSGLTEVTTPSQPSRDIWEVPNPAKAPQETTMEHKKAVLPWKKTGGQKNRKAPEESPSQPLGDIWELPVSPEKAPKEDITKRPKAVLPWKKTEAPKESPSQPSGDIWEVPNPVKAPLETTMECKKAVLPRKKKEAQKTYGKVSRIRSSPRQDMFAATIEADSVEESRELVQPSNASPDTKVDLDTSRQLPSSAVVIPQTDEQLRPTSLSLKRKADDSSSFVGDTFPGDAPEPLFVAPSALSSSQKKQYAAVSISSQEQSEPTLSSKADHPANVRGSSASATTIAYPTPTQFKSSRARPAATGTSSLSDAPRVDGVDGDILSSSPDIISATERNVKRKKVQSGLEIVHLSSEADVPAMTRSARKKAGARMNEEMSRGDDDWDSDAIGFHRETYNPRSSRRRSLGTTLPVVAECDEIREPTLVDQSTRLSETNAHNEDAPKTSLPSPVPEDAVATAEVDKPAEEKPKKKRGRKKKEAKIKETVPEETGDAGMPDRPEVSPAGQEAREVVGPVTRKRGRAKKSDTSQAKSATSQKLAADEPEPPTDGPKGRNEDELDVLAPATADDPDSAPPPKKKRKGKATAPPHEPVLVDDQAVEAEDPSVGSDEKVLGEMSHNSCASVDAKPDEETDAAAPTDAKENLGPAKTVVKDPVKPGSLLQSGKVQYRVGLSKRSRIAPLLKMVRK